MISTSYPTMPKPHQSFARCLTSRPALVGAALGAAALGWSAASNLGATGFGDSTSVLANTLGVGVGHSLNIYQHQPYPVAQGQRLADSLIAVPALAAVASTVAGLVGRTAGLPGVLGCALVGAGLGALEGASCRYLAQTP